MRGSDRKLACTACCYNLYYSYIIYWKCNKSVIYPQHIHVKYLNYFGLIFFMYKNIFVELTLCLKYGIALSDSSELYELLACRTDTRMLLKGL